MYKKSQVQLTVLAIYPARMGLVKFFFAASTVVWDWMSPIRGVSPQPLANQNLVTTFWPEPGCEAFKRMVHAQCMLLTMIGIQYLHVVGFGSKFRILCCCDLFVLIVCKCSNLTIMQI